MQVPDPESAPREGQEASLGVPAASSTDPREEQGVSASGRPQDPGAEEEESQASGSAAGAAASEEPPEEEQVATSPHGTATNEALRAMARAARSFLLYDPGNEAIRGFLKEVRDSFAQALGFGSVVLDIRPFEMILGDECVYLERDRERSLAFRLYRDGVRRLALGAEVPWPELLRLLEILSIRYTGVRQQEDDVVTLLWKSGFKHIEITAVEGFVPEDNPEEAELAEARSAAVRAAGGQVEVPRDWDTPLPPHEQTADYGYRALTDEELAPLQAEVSSARLPDHAVRLVREMLDLVADPRDPIVFTEVAPLLDEVRLFLLSEGQLGRLLELARAIEGHPGIDPETVSRELSRFVDKRALLKIVGSASSGSDAAPGELLALLDRVPGAHLRHLVDLLGEVRSESARRMVRNLIQRHVGKHQEWLLKEIAKIDGSVAADLVRAVSTAAPGVRPDLVARCIGRTESEIQREVERMVRDLPLASLPLRSLHEYLDQAASVRVRLALLLRMGDHDDARSVDRLLKHLDGPKGGRLSNEEVIFVGQTLARISSGETRALLLDWVRPARWWDRVRGVTGGRNRQWAGVAGLGLLEGDDAESALRWLSERAGEELHQHCLKTLVHRRRTLTEEAG